MPPRVKGDYCVLLYDTNARDAKYLRQIVIELYAIKRYMTKQNIFLQVFLLGTKETRNPWKYEHIYQVYNSDKTATCFHADSLAKIIKSHKGDFRRRYNYNWMEALMAGTLSFPGVSAESSCLQMFFITDMSTPICLTEEDGNAKALLPFATKLIKEIQERDIYVYILGPFRTVKDESVGIQLKDRESIDDWWSQFAFDPMADVDEHNGRMLRGIVESTPHTLVADAKLGPTVYSLYRKDFGLQPSNLDFTVTCYGLEKTHATKRKRRMVGSRINGTEATQSTIASTDSSIEISSTTSMPLSGSTSGRSLLEQSSTAPPTDAEPRDITLMRVKFTRDLYLRHHQVNMPQVRMRSQQTNMIAESKRRRTGLDAGTKLFSKNKSPYRRYVLRRDPCVFLEWEQIVNGVRLGDKFIPLTTIFDGPEPFEHDRDALPSLRLLHFVRDDEVPAEYYYGPEHFSVTFSDIQQASKRKTSAFAEPSRRGKAKVLWLERRRIIFDALLRTMRRKKVFAVVRRKDGQRRFAAAYGLLMLPKQQEVVKNLSDDNDDEGPSSSTTTIKDEARLIYVPLPRSDWLQRQFRHNDIISSETYKKLVDDDNNLQRIGENHRTNVNGDYSLNQRKEIENVLADIESDLCDDHDLVREFLQLSMRETIVKMPVTMGLLPDPDHLLCAIQLTRKRMGLRASTADSTMPSYWNDLTTRADAAAAATFQKE